MKTSANARRVLSFVAPEQALPNTSSRPVDIHAVLSSRQTAWKVPELASLLTVGRRTLYDAVDSGQLPSFKIGIAVRISPSAALDWLEDRSTGLNHRGQRRVLPRCTPI